MHFCAKQSDEHRKGIGGIEVVIDDENAAVLESGAARSCLWCRGIHAEHFDEGTGLPYAFTPSSSVLVCWILVRAPP
ncbi:hypothetical protein GCM10027343_29270 [Noviherbaspirillum agri]